MTTAFIALGANLGDRQANIQKAIRLLDETDGISVKAVSEILESDALAQMDQPAYLDAVAQVGTDLRADKLFDRMSSIEDTLGRIRQEKWSPRTIDLDLLLYADQVIEGPMLTIPHNQMHLRSFVLNGMCELAPDFIHPVLKQSMKELASRLNGQNFFLSQYRPQLISVAGLIAVGKTTLASGLAKEFNCPMLAEAYDTNPFMPDVYAGDTEHAIDSQLYFLNSRLEQLNPDKLTSAVPVVSDYIFDKETIFAARTLSPDQSARHKQQYDTAIEQVAKPVVAVYLYDSPQACLSRIAARNRPYEQDIDIETLKTFAQDYDNLFGNWKVCPLIKLDANTFNCTDPEQVREFAQHLRHYIWKSQPK
jgi:deoxyguanosine kinase